MGDLDIYEKQSFGHRLGFGRRTALLIVDFTVGFNDPALFGGGNIDPAIRRTVDLLAFFRGRKLPIAFTRVVFADDGSDAGVFGLKVPSLRILTDSHPAGQIVPQLEPRRNEYIVKKQHASAFFGTSLAPWLVHHGADTVVVAGCTTSGCVRASVVDASAHNFRPIVARDCVGDRALGPHEANLFDMGQKYADVLDAGEIIDALAARPQT
jgi:maleamate amidohydrolase